MYDLPSEERPPDYVIENDRKLDDWVRRKVASIKSGTSAGATQDVHRFKEDDEWTVELD